MKILAVLASVASFATQSNAVSNLLNTKPWSPASMLINIADPKLLT